MNINGPNGKSDSLTMYIHSDEYEKNKNDQWWDDLIIPDIHIR